MSPAALTTASVQRITAPYFFESASSFAAVASIELENIALRDCSIMDVTAEWGRFDYIIAHGVYSWVPAAVREKIMTIFRDGMTVRTTKEEATWPILAKGLHRPAPF